MILLEPNRTPYDLRFELFGTPVRVHPLFWLFSAILGWPLMKMENGFGYLLIWIACSFLSILLHEFGHIWMGRAFGRDGYIVLYSFGGLAVGSNELGERWQRILVSLAGPGIQLALWAAIYYGLKALPVEQLARLTEPMRLTIGILLAINLYWPLMNLLPVWPLDGGQVSREVLSAASPRDGLRWSLSISMIVAALLAVNSLYAEYHDGRGFLFPDYLPGGGFFTLILFASLAVQSYQILQIVQQQPTWQYEEPDDRLPWER